MEEKYWRRFLSTGKVEDYLSYKSENGGDVQGERLKDVGVDKRESDRSDRDDTVERSRGGI